MSKQGGSEASEAGLIELKVDTVHDLFHALDPSPFTERDLARDAEEFIVGWAIEHPKDIPLELRVHLSETITSDLEARVQDAIHNYFEYKRDITARRLNQLMRQSWLNLFIGIVFLAVCLGGADMSRRMGEAPIYQIANYSFIIAGWVAMSRPMEMFLYKWWPIRQERFVYDRLASAKVHVVSAKA